MSIKFECYNCKQSLEAEDTMKGQMFACPGCNAAIEVPLPVLPKVSPKKVKQLQRGGNSAAPAITSAMPKSKMKRNLLIAVVMIAVVGAGGYFAYIKGILPKEITAVIKKTSTGAVTRENEGQKLKVPGADAEIKTGTDTRIIGNEGQKLKIPGFDLEIIINNAEMYSASEDSLIGVRVRGEVTNTGKLPIPFGMNNKYIFDKEFRALPMKYATPNKSYGSAGCVFEDLSLNSLESVKFMFEYEVPIKADLSIVYWGVLKESEIIYLIKTNLNYAEYIKDKKELLKSSQVPKGFEVLAPSVPSTNGWASEIRHKATGIEMVYVAPGEFMMGSPASEKGRKDYETQHKVKLTKGYYIGKYEVTQRQWEKVTGKTPSALNGGELPVERVKWDDCQSFCKNLGSGFRFPTEAEWEFAARGGSKTKGFVYSGSNNLEEVRWNDQSKTHTVGQKKANELGLYDMSGNVWEWCSDWYGEYPSSSVTDPTGPTADSAARGDVSGPARVARGGGYDNDNCRLARRSLALPDSRGTLLGFRLALTAGQ